MMRNFKTERELEPNASRNCFWELGWLLGTLGQLLANFFPCT